ncbi:cobalt-zinc-cadmium efflux system protein [Friedmanniella endophytica]|uniref:Cobalt-zinc-cadmium efflux system protein n=1 Tax=Microlunatus kandeliicorticis TaxID=1759536 RepID=A0A7W3IVQ6_9ACTN|nr:cation diffusion facilitator family transporter [Microlunatus kandeliicorticis]MBA8796055.1 cobalt-zinc-cadmium efflux system protein [Microlunatus kandeliicorticis]
MSGHAHDGHHHAQGPQHGTGHGHSHGDAHDPADRRRIAVVLGITSVVLVTEVVGAGLTGSLALLADAGHMLTDVVGLVLALVAAHLVGLPSSKARTWGFRRAEVLAAAAQALLLLGVGGYVLVEGIRRLISPESVASTGMLVFGVVGLVGNAVSMAVLSARRGANLNLRAAFLEVLNDALGSVAVIVAAAVIALTGWLRADAVVSLLIAALIVPRTVRLLRETAGVLLESTPAGLDLDDVRAHIVELPHVREVHDLHATQIATGLPVLTAHVVVDPDCFYDGHVPRLLDSLQRCVAEHFPISVEHSTFQLEPAGHADHETGRHG